jgi:hypothetical protein
LQVLLSLAMAGAKSIPCEKKLKEMRKCYLVQLVYERANLIAAQPALPQFFAVAAAPATAPTTAPAIAPATASATAPTAAEDATDLARQVAEADEEAEAHRTAADAALRLEASQGLEDDVAIELATGEGTEATAQQEYDEAASYAEELSSERNLPFPCGIYGCGKRYSTREELQRSGDGKEMGCRGGPFGWCVAAPTGERRKRRARVRLGEE